MPSRAATTCRRSLTADSQVVLRRSGYSHWLLKLPVTRRAGAVLAAAGRAPVAVPRCRAPSEPRRGHGAASMCPIGVKELIRLGVQQRLNWIGECDVAGGLLQLRAATTYSSPRVLVSFSLGR